MDSKILIERMVIAEYYRKGRIWNGEKLYKFDFQN